jgi:predicted DCC family thiol-disulfide oxidoreductase YuxK
MNMKTLTDHVIIYDDECPMCDLYTGAFVKTGMLDSNGREPYSWLHKSIKKHIDTQRARNEIALVNLKTGQVLYGIDSLFMILANRYRLLKPLFSFAPFRLMTKIVYSFISYNRRVIIPASKFEGKNSCTPDFHPGYRIAYLIFTWIVVSLVLTSYSRLLVPVIPETNFYREFAVCGGQIVFQSLVLTLIRRDRLVHYAGNMMTISLAGAILLMPALIIGNAGMISPPGFFTGWFLIVAALMFLEHMRRTTILEIHWIVSATWVIYRLMVLWIIL